MKTNFSQCDFLKCRYQFNGNCTYESEYNICEFNRLRIKEHDAQIAWKDGDKRKAREVLTILYMNQLAKDGRGCTKTSIREALLMGAYAISVCDKIPNVVEELEELKQSLDGHVFDSSHSHTLAEIETEKVNEVVDEAIKIVKQLLL